MSPLKLLMLLLLLFYRVEFMQALAVRTVRRLRETYTQRSFIHCSNDDPANDLFDSAADKHAQAQNFILRHRPAWHTLTSCS